MGISRYRYLHYDVFTDRRFGGNQLAVFPQAAGLPAQTMQQIAANRLRRNDVRDRAERPDPTAHADFHAGHEMPWPATRSGQHVRARTRWSDRGRTR